LGLALLQGGGRIDGQHTASVSLKIVNSQAVKLASLCPSGVNPMFSSADHSGKPLMDTMAGEETEESVVFNLHDKPRLLARASKENSHSIVKQVQWYMTLVQELILGLQTALLS